jgi:hypothetical protein
MPISPKTASVFFQKNIKMSAPEVEGGQDHDDILGFPGDGYQDPQDGGPPETMDEDLDSGTARMTEESGCSDTNSDKKRVKKRRKSVPVPPDEFVGDRIKELKTTITGLKTDTVKGKLGSDRSFKTNQIWVAPTHGGSKEAAPKWSWYGTLFILAPFDLLSGK